MSKFLPFFFISFLSYFSKCIIDVPVGMWHVERFSVMCSQTHVFDGIWLGAALGGAWRCWRDGMCDIGQIDNVTVNLSSGWLDSAIHISSIQGSVIEALGNASVKVGYHDALLWCEEWFVGILHSPNIILGYSTRLSWEHTGEKIFNIQLVCSNTPAHTHDAQHP